MGERNKKITKTAIEKITKNNKNSNNRKNNEQATEQAKIQKLV